MTQANTARRDGDSFQARLFWLNAAKLLDQDSNILRVGFESGPKGFDDIWVEYDPKHAPPDPSGRCILREHIQCKWHVNPDSYGYLQLVDPEFINANSQSLLQRARRAQVDFSPTGEGVRFKLLTNWRLNRTDPLRSIVATRSGALKLDRLYGTSTDNSKTGAIRKSWREHLGIDESELKLLAGTLAFGEATDSLESIREQLDMLFGFVGLRRVPANQIAFSYDDLPFQWAAQGRLEYDRTSFRTLCEQQDLLGSKQKRPAMYGVKSFEHPLDRIEDRCVKVLDLVPEFDDRFIRSDLDWVEKLYPSLKSFLHDVAKQDESLRLVLDAHVTLAFAAGSVLNLKSGRVVELEQRTPSRRIWAADDVKLDPVWSKLEYELIVIDENRPDMAVAVSLTHDISTDVRTYINQALPSVGRLLVCRPDNGSGSNSVMSGSHAFNMAQSLCAQVKQTRPTIPHSTLHMFLAGPNGFAFFIGQHNVAMGKTCLYEFDFEGGRDRSYRPSLTVPIG